jgi:hypothetical protein
MINHWNRLKFRRKLPSWQGNDSAPSVVTDNFYRALQGRLPERRAIGPYMVTTGSKPYILLT